MSQQNNAHWIVAYDISDKKRLSRVHRFIRKRCVALQFSMFAAVKTERQARELMSELELLIDSEADDVRIYKLPRKCKVWQFGPDRLPPGIILAADELLNLLLAHSTETVVEQSAS